MANMMISSAPKPTLNYRVVVGYNPKEEENNLLRPIIINKETYDTSRCLRFAMDNGYITAGQFYSNFGVVSGFLEGVQALGKDGRDITLNGWLRIYSTLTGTCDPETRVMGPENEIPVCAQVQTNLRRKASEFTWECVADKSVRATVQHIQSVGGAKDKEIYANAKISVGGTNLSYTSATDKVTASWQTTNDETGVVTDHSVELTPESSGYSAMVLPFPEELEDAPVGTVVTFTFFLRRGNASASVIPAIARAKFVTA